MEKEEKRGKYQGLSLPVSLIDEVKEHIEGRREYSGVTKFVRQAIISQLQYEKGKIWSEDAIRDWRKFKGIFAKKNDDQDAFKELIRTVIREEEAKK